MNAVASNAPTGALPNLIVVGAQKCGTSALHYYLGLHPEVQMSSPKELSFFLSEDDFHPEPFISEPEERRLFGRTWNWSRGPEWYASHFRADAPVRGESTPGYASLWYPGVAGKMAEVVPEARLIFLARDPIERLVSHYMHARVGGAEWRPLPAAVGPKSVYVARSRYASLLRPFLDRFPRDRILLLRQEHLLDRRRYTLRHVFRFLGVTEDFWSPKMERLRQQSGRKGRGYGIAQRLSQSRIVSPIYRLPQEAKWLLERMAYGRPREADRPPVDAALRARLLEELEPEIARLEELTGWDLAEWRAGAPAPSAV
jgi:hypothetical protein